MAEDLESLEVKVVLTKDWSALAVEADEIIELHALSVQFDRAGALSKDQPFPEPSQQIDR